MSDYYDRDKFTGGRQGPPPPQRKPENNRGWYSWPLIIVFFSIGLWPVALVLLMVNLFGGDGKKPATAGGVESAVERAMRRAEERTGSAARQAADRMNQAAGRVDRAVRQAEDAVRGGVRTGAAVTEQALQRARQEAEAAARMVLHGGRRDFDEMAQILNTALDKAKILAELERQAAQQRQQAQSQATPRRSGYADARPVSGPQPAPNPQPASGPLNGAQNRKQSGQKTAKPQKQKKMKLPGKMLRFLGICLLVLGSILGLDFLANAAQGYYVDFEEFFTTLGFLAGGGIMFGRGRYLANMTRRSQRYILAIGNADVMALDEIAKRVNRKPAQAAKELQKLIDKGYLGEDAYVDRERGYFVRFGATLEEEAPRPVQTRQEEAPPPPEAEEGGYSTVLRSIRRANQRIADPALSRKIERIEQVTALILKEVEVHPEKRERLHTFFDYYLPTTQKLLDTYADFEATGVEGANLRQAKARIAETMDAIVAGFERQLDHLYSADAMDIAADIQVMEAMLNRDGATASQEFGYHEDEEEDGGFRPLQL